MSKSGYKGEGKSRLFKPCVSPCKRYHCWRHTRAVRGLLGSGARGGCIQWRGWLPPLWALAAAYAPLPKILVYGRDFHEWAPRFGVPLLPRQSGVCTRGAHSSIWRLPPDRAPAPGELAVRRRQLPPAERARRSTNLPSRRRRWRASMSRPNPCSMRSCWRWWLALSINLKLIGQPSSRPSRAEANSMSVSCALGRHLRIGACRFFPICMLRFVDRGEDRTRPASSFQL